MSNPAFQAFDPENQQVPGRGGNEIVPVHGTSQNSSQTANELLGREQTAPVETALEILIRSAAPIPIVEPTTRARLLQLGTREVVRSRYWRWLRFFSACAVAGILIACWMFFGTPGSLKEDYLTIDPPTSNEASPNIPVTEPANEETPLPQKDEWGLVASMIETREAQLKVIASLMKPIEETYTTTR